MPFSLLAPFLLSVLVPKHRLEYLKFLASCGPFFLFAYFIFPQDVLANNYFHLFVFSNKVLNPILMLQTIKKVILLALPKMLNL